MTVRVQCPVGCMLLGILLLSACAANAQQNRATAPPLIDEITDAVVWTSWKSAAFQKAAEERKAVFLSVESRWQYDSQAMRLYVYQDAGLAEAIHKDLVPIRVDADQRPDLARRYAPDGVPAVILLDSAGMPLQDPRSGKFYSGIHSSTGEIHSMIKEIAGRLERNALAELRTPLPAPWKAKAAKADVFSDNFVRIILEHISARYDEVHGGYGDPARYYQPKRAEVETLGLLLTGAKLLDDPRLLEPLSPTLNNMFGGSFYRGGFGEEAEMRSWNRFRNEKTLKTNMGLLEIYLRAFQQLGDNRFMEAAYQTLDDTERFQDMFLKKGFSGAFYSAERSLMPPDLQRGMDEGAMVQSLITPWACQGVRSYLLAAEWTNDRRWRKLALKALDFLRTEMVHPGGGLAYSLDRTAVGSDTLFAAYPALASTLVEAFERTTDRGELEEAGRLMQEARALFWQEPGYFSDIVLAEENIGLLKQPGVDLDANAKAVEVLMKLAVLTGEESYRQWARSVLSTLAGEAQSGANESAAFAVAVLKYIHHPVHVIVVGKKGHTGTGALRDAALLLNHPHLVVEVVDPEVDAGRLAALGLTASDSPQAHLRLDMLAAASVSDPAQMPEALEELIQKMK